METWLIICILFLSMFLFLTLGLPISFTLGGLSVVGCFVMWNGSAGLYQIVTTAYGEMTSFVLISIPLFLFMGYILHYSGIADDLYEMVYRWLTKLAGGLAIGTIGICAIFAAMLGVSSVGSAMMGVVALPSMLSRGYEKRLAVGAVAAGGALGALIPPSVVMIFYAVMSGESVGKMFMGGVIPGMLLSLLFMLYIGFRCFINKNLAPPGDKTFSWKERLHSLRLAIMPVGIIALVLGVIFLGWATPTEAAAIGVIASLATAAINKRLSFRMIYNAQIEAMRVTCMALWIMIGAVCFSRLLTVAGAPELLINIMGNLGLNRWTVLILTQISWFLLGCVIDPFGIIVITTPLYVPLIIELGFDPLWFGILFMVNMEMAFITPPFGFNLFVLKGVLPPTVTVGDLYRSVTPYVLVQALALALVMVFPSLALWLPSLMIAK